LVAALAAPHAIGGAAPIELRPAFAETEERTVAERERQHAALRVDAKLLHAPAVLAVDTNRQRIIGKMNDEVARMDRVDANVGGTRGRRRRNRRIEGAVDWNRLQPSVVDREDAD